MAFECTCCRLFCANIQEIKVAELLCKFISSTRVVESGNYNRVLSNSAKTIEGSILKSSLPCQSEKTTHV